ncbi:MAG: ATP-binding cassette domain-containing protein [Bdellovibrionales bacterium]|nr:ATP-binding cassette domain-containing protein [Bdellovibrionales bacterium]
MRLLEVRGLSKSFSPVRGLTVSARVLDLFRNGSEGQRPVPVLDKVDLSVESGECVAVVGLNGTGKSTLLRCIAGVMAPSGGSVSHQGRFLALLCHGFGNYEDLTVDHNIRLALQLFGLTRREATGRIRDVAKFAGITHRLNYPASQLSEGMRAKLALCCLEMVSFDLLVLDESLSHVDSEFRETFLELTRKWMASGRSVLMTSHDEGIVGRFATRKLELRDRKLLPRP